MALEAEGGWLEPGAGPIAHASVAGQRVRESQRAARLREGGEAGQRQAAGAH